MTTEAAARVLAMVGIVRDEHGGPAEASLPLDVRLFTMTEPELHDLIYHAVTQTLTHLAKVRAHELAGRAAARGCVAATASDYVHAGADPRG